MVHVYFMSMFPKNKCWKRRIFFHHKTKKNNNKRNSMTENWVAICWNGPQHRKTTTTKKSPQKLLTKNNKKIHLYFCNKKYLFVKKKNDSQQRPTILVTGVSYFSFLMTKKVSYQIFGIFEIKCQPSVHLLNLTISCWHCSWNSPIFLELLCNSSQ